ncbi:hypothetical protein M3202_18520 [Alkalihalobacillus oceani]|uniref:Lipoprotein n=1 Tax=Halalkalibacter oceani TaxID=1653776 RepID=A0A9X2DVB5_9BACI|nr:hypothetical protein [Halalkalibacter oceani]MCM3716050.1 hypothetical protein [Halalkalibacter oceani]
MYKNVLFIFMFLGALFFLTGCSLSLLPWWGDDEEIEQTVDPNEEYADLVTDVFNDSNVLLQRFNKMLDQLYGQQISKQAVAQELEEIVPLSNQLLLKLDDVLYNVDDRLYDLHRELIVLINFQHQTFLRCLEMSKDDEEEIDKDQLRQDYVKIKSDQTLLVQNIKQALQQILFPAEE